MDWSLILLTRKYFLILSTAKLKLQFAVQYSIACLQSDISKEKTSKGVHFSFLFFSHIDWYFWLILRTEYTGINWGRTSKVFHFSSDIAVTDHSGVGIEIHIAVTEHSGVGTEIYIAVTDHSSVHIKTLLWLTTVVLA